MLLERGRGANECDEDPAAYILDIEGLQTPGGPIQIRIAVGARQVDERAARIVGPAVRRATHATIDTERETGRDVAVDQARAAMAANVEECRETPIPTPEQQRGTATEIETYRRTGRRQVGFVTDELPARAQATLDIDREYGLVGDARAVQLRARASTRRAAARHRLRRRVTAPMSRPVRSPPGRCSPRAHPRSSLPAARFRPRAPTRAATRG